MTSTRKQHDSEHDAKGFLEDHIHWSQKLLEDHIRWSRERLEDHIQWAREYAQKQNVGPESQEQAEKDDVSQNIEDLIDDHG